LQLALNAEAVAMRVGLLGLEELRRRLYQTKEEAQRVEKLAVLALEVSAEQYSLAYRQKLARHSIVKEGR